MYEKQNPDDFAWPCDRRDAHGGHGECPGVKAHPRTMAGTFYRKTEH